MYYNGFWTQYIRLGRDDKCNLEDWIMANAMELFAKELLTYDTHVGENDMFYYNLPYERNYDLTNTIPIANVSGNVIKFYQYQLGKPVVIFTDTVDTTYELSDEDDLAEGIEDAEESLDEIYDEDADTRELSDEELAALTEDGDFSEEDDYTDEEEAFTKEPSTSVSEENGDEEVWEAPQF